MESNNIRNAYASSKVINSDILKECESKNHIPMGRTGPLVVKMPVVLSDTEIRIDLNTKFKLNISVADYKISNRVAKLIDCKLIPHSNKLSIEGFIQQDIEYPSFISGRMTNSRSSLRSITVDFPFRCVTEINFFRSPIYGEEYKKRIGRSDEREEGWIHYSKIQEPIYCELEYTEIIKMDTNNTNESDSNITGLKGNSISEVIENLLLVIKLKVLQNQLVFIPELDGNVILAEKVKDYDIHELNIKDSTDLHEVEVGFDPKRGLVGKIHL